VKKITISGLTVTIVEERYFEIEITATGQRLKPRQYLKLSQEEVAARYRTLAELQAAWADKDRREALIRDLEAQNVSLVLLAACRRPLTPTPKTCWPTWLSTRPWSAATSGPRPSSTATRTSWAASRARPGKSSNYWWTNIASGASKRSPSPRSSACGL